MNPPAEKKSPAFPIVVLCCSAGGLESCRTILRELPSDTGMAFVIISHRGLENPTLFRQLLARRTRMEVVDATEGMSLEPNRVFIAPPQLEMTTDGFALNLRKCPAPVGWPILITVFLRSLAKMCASRTVAVILSGMGYDGSAALALLKKGGAVTFAQSDAQYPSMPESAIKTGHVDFEMAAWEIGERLSAMGSATKPVSPAGL